MKKINRNQKNYMILGTIVVLILVIILVPKLVKDSSIKQDFNIDETAKVTRIVLEDLDGNKSDLTRKDDSTWMINNQYQAAPVMIETLLETLKDMRIREPIAKAAHPNVIKQLSTRRIKCDVYQRAYYIHIGFIKLFEHQKLVKTIYVGGQTMDNMGTYMLLKGTKEPCIVYIPNFRGFLSPRFTPVASLWRVHTMFKISPKEISSIKVELPSIPQESFILYSESNTFKMRLLQSGQVLPIFDTLKVTTLLSAFMNLNFETIAEDISAVQRDTIFTKTPSFIFTVKDKKGHQKRLRTYMKLNQGTWVSPKDKDNFYQIFDINRMYGLMDDIKDTLILQYYALDNILKPASYYFYKQNKPTNKE